MAGAGGGGASDCGGGCDWAVCIGSSGGGAEETGSADSDGAVSDFVVCAVRTGLGVTLAGGAAAGVSAGAAGGVAGAGCGWVDSIGAGAGPAWGAGRRAATK